MTSNHSIRSNKTIPTLIFCMLLFSLLHTTLIISVSAADTDTGWCNPRGAEDDHLEDPPYGKTTWKDVENTLLEDDNFAINSVNLDNTPSHYLWAHDYQFNIDDTVTITGIEVRIKKALKVGNGVFDDRVRIIKNRVIGSVDKSDASEWSSSLQWITYGGNGDLWGETWTPEEICDRNFGVAISVKNEIFKSLVLVDAIQIKVYYSVSSNSPPDVPSDPTPTDGQSGVSLDPTLTVYVSDPDGDDMDVSFYNAIDYSLIGTVHDVSSGSYATTEWNDLDYDSSYNWYVIADDGVCVPVSSVVWSFTTTSVPNNCPNQPSLNSPSNGAVDQPISISLSADVVDIDGDALTVTFFNASDNSIIGIDSSVVGSGTASVVWSGLANSLVYSWFVQSSDGVCVPMSSVVWSFTTTSAPNNCPEKPNTPNPSNGSTDQPTSVTLQVNVTDVDGDALVVTFFDASDDSEIGNNSTIVGSGNASIAWISLSNGQTYSWYAISSDGLLDNRSSTWSFTTVAAESTSPPGYTSPPAYTPPPNHAPDTPVIECPGSGIINEAYTFYTSSSDSDNNKIKYRFDWGNEIISDWTDLFDSDETIIVEHSWDTPGTYEIKAQAKDSNGKESSWSEPITIIIEAILLYEFIDDSDGEITIEISFSIDHSSDPILIQFDGSQSYAEGEDNNIASFEWDFNDDGIIDSIEPNPTYTYEEGGKHTITLTVTDTNGQSKTTTHEIDIPSSASSTAGSTTDTSQQKQENQNLLLLFLLSIIIVAVIAIFFIVVYKYPHLISRKNQLEEEQAVAETPSNSLLYEPPKIQPTPQNSPVNNIPVALATPKNNNDKSVEGLVFDHEIIDDKKSTNLEIKNQNNSSVDKEDKVTKPAKELSKKSEIKHETKFEKTISSSSNGLSFSRGLTDNSRFNRAVGRSNNSFSINTHDTITKNTVTKKASKKNT